MRTLRAPSAFAMRHGPTHHLQANYHLIGRAETYPNSFDSSLGAENSDVILLQPECYTFGGA